MTDHVPPLGEAALEFAKSEVIAQKAGRNRLQIIRGLVAVILVLALVGGVYVRGIHNQLAEGERQRAALTEEVTSLRNEQANRDRQDACVTQLGGALQLAIGRILQLSFDPERPAGQPPDPHIFVPVFDDLKRALDERDRAATTCAVTP